MGSMNLTEQCLTKTTVIFFSFCRRVAVAARPRGRRGRGRFATQGSQGSRSLRDPGVAGVAAISP